ncbi:hypothetical protein [Undibacterium sp.]|uniref:hypothetical protein n=1 Tax=Undibacterium sp. TaxID=1914977 RepID=UPI00374CDAF7
MSSISSLTLRHLNEPTKLTAASVQQSGSGTGSGSGVPSVQASPQDLVVISPNAKILSELTNESPSMSRTVSPEASANRAGELAGLAETKLADEVDGIDDDALSYLTPKDIQKLEKAYADARALGIDPRMIDAAAISLGSHRRADEQAGEKPQQRASASMIKDLTAAIHARARGNGSTENSSNSSVLGSKSLFS